ncbi:MAG TPA: hypothetical protein VMY35_13370 [Phycisphaerae bacterium]|nr:hypothetical protein [Phycisphaerae bacterium]
MCKSLFVAAALCLVSAQVLAQGTFPLKYQDLDPQAEPALQMANKYARRTDKKPPAVVAGPTGAAEAVTYFGLPLGDGTRWFAIVAATPPKLYADTNGNNDLSDEKAVDGADQNGMVSFGPVTLAAGENASVQVRAMTPRAPPGVPVSFLRVLPAGGVVGDITLGGQAYRAMLVDGNLNGRYGDTCSDLRNLQAADLLAIDLNQNGRFDMPNLESTDALETLPLTSGMKVGEAYYRIRAAADGSQIQAEKIEPTFGTLEVDVPGLTFLTLSDFGFQRIGPVDGKASVVAGKYTVLQMTLAQRDEAGAEWTLSGRGGKGETFQILSDQTLQLQLGPPLKASVEVRQTDGATSMTFSLIGRGEEVYAGGASKDGKMQPAPKLEILDETGKVLAIGTFAYG